MNILNWAKELVEISEATLVYRSPRGQTNAVKFDPAFEIQGICSFLKMIFRQTSEPESELLRNLLVRALDYINDDLYVLKEGEISPAEDLAEWASKVVVDDEFLRMIASGVEAKLFAYDEYIKENTRCVTQVNLHRSLEILFKKDIEEESSCVILNLEHHTDRYANTVKELERISCTKLAPFKGTFWKNRKQFEEDLTFVMRFLSQYHPQIDTTREYKFDEFSETHDPNIWIQDGPLACYCSHLRAMIYGYLNTKDYTLIVEDDICIANTVKIYTYLSQIPDDWDIIMVGSISKLRELSNLDTFYKFEEDFHSTHFYIIRNSSFPKIFQGMYPVIDQVDVLLANLKNKLNIYNIPYSIYQKDIGTHTQNNLHAIFNSPNYEALRNSLSIIRKQCLFFCNMFLSGNEVRNKVIAGHLLYDVIFEYLLKSGMDGTESLHKEAFETDFSQYYSMSEYKSLFRALYFFIRCCKKGIDPQRITKSLLNNLLFTIQQFALHGESLKALAFGSSAHIYVGNGTVVKRYNDKLRWMAECYDDPKLIFENEVSLLKIAQGSRHVPRLIDVQDNLITLSYEGESLYDKFELPLDWEEQIREIFVEFDSLGINYPEFKLQNILVNNGNIVFVDFGMARLNSTSNKSNCEKFCKWLNMLEARLSNVSLHKRHELINTFYRNINSDGRN